MALDKEVILSNESLSGLDEKQIEALVTLSANDENKVIGSKVKEMHTYYEKDFETVTGLKKPDGVKGYVWIKENLGNIYSKAQKVSEFETKVSELSTAKTELEKQLKSGNIDEATKAKIETLERQVNDKSTMFESLQAKYKTDLEAKETAYKQAQQEMQNYKIQSQLDNELTGFNFKKTYEKDVIDTMISNAKSKLMSSATLDENNKLVFRDKDGNLLTNSSNLNNPFTAKELLEDSLKSIIDKGVNQNGTGSKGGQQNDSVIDISSASTQVQADTLIKQHLATLGITTSHKNWQSKFTELRTSNNVKSLPIK